MSDAGEDQAPGRGGARRREVSRLEALADAIFGFSATLLVVSLEVPRTYAELEANVAGFVPFALSFTMLLFIWLAHGAYFRRYGLEDAPTVVINSVLLFVILFFVYPLKFLATSFSQFMFGIGGETGRAGSALRSSDELASLFAIYGLGFVAVFLCFVLLYRHALRCAGALGLAAVERFDAATKARHYLMFVVVGAVSVLVAWSGFGIRFGAPGYVYFLLAPLCFWNGWSRSRRRALLREPSGSAAAPPLPPPATAAR